MGKFRSVTILFSENYERGKNVEVSVFYEVYDARNPENVCGYWPGVLNVQYSKIRCKPARVGTYVQLTMKATTYLQLHEVEVHGIQDIFTQQLAKGQNYTAQQCNFVL